jgi:4'-phosphopantetheinyl transferase
LDHYGIPIKPFRPLSARFSDQGTGGLPESVQFHVMTIPDRLFGDRADFPWLSERERQVAAAFAGRKRRAQYAAGRLLVRYALDQAPGGKGRDWRVEADASGRLEVAGGGVDPAPAVSLSHSGSLALCGLKRSGGLLGVDIERCVPRRSGWTALAGFVLHPREQERLAGLDAPERWRGFYRSWTLKEALAKALGVGLALPFDRIAFSADGRLEAAPGDCGLEREEWRFTAFELEERWLGAAAWNLV